MIVYNVWAPTGDEGDCPNIFVGNIAEARRVARELIGTVEDDEQPGAFGEYAFIFRIIAKTSGKGWLLNVLNGTSWMLSKKRVLFAHRRSQEKCVRFLTEAEWIELRRPFMEKMYGRPVADSELL